MTGISILGIIAREKKILATQLTKELQLTDEDRLRSYVSKLIEKAIIISDGQKKGTAYLINPKLIANSKINVKPSLRAIEPHRLKALIEEDLKLYPNSKTSDIQKRISDLPIEDIRKCITILLKEGVILSSGQKKGKTYFLA